MLDILGSKLTATLDKPTSLILSSFHWFFKLQYILLLLMTLPEGYDIKDLLHVNDAAQVFNALVGRKVTVLYKCYSDKKECNLSQP